MGLAAPQIGVNRRVAIIDLSGGSQPMATADGRILIVFNGEIYNFADTRAWLLSRGHGLRTRCDTETVLYGWREEGTRIGLKEQFSILDSDDVLNVLKDAGGTTDAKQAQRWQWTISLWKNNGIGPLQAAQIAADDDERAAAAVMARYQERLAAYQAVDFDDLITLPLKLLTTDAEAREKWQNKLRYVLVDE